MDSLRFLAQRALLSHSRADGHQQWRSVFAGGWTIVDHFDAEGCRYLIARRAGASAALAPAEQQLLERRAAGEGLKTIAADLGISVSAVSRRLASAMRRLGLRSHTELARLFSTARDPC